MSATRGRMVLAAALVCAGAFASAIDAPRGVAASPADHIAGPYGGGSDAVWLVIPNRTVRSVVVFGHGWKLTPEFPGHPWVDQFRPWLDHLAAAGSAVIFPAYQPGTGAGSGTTLVRSYETGLQSGYAHLGKPQVPWLAFGYSYGASLAFYYAANARAWRLPVPRAVQATFPAFPIPGAPLPPLDPSIRVLIQVGDADTEAGSGGANEFWSWLSGHPSARKQYEIIRSSPELAATHAAPKSTTAAAQRAFWAPLDRLIALSR